MGAATAIASPVTVQEVTHFFRIANAAGHRTEIVCALDDISLDIPDHQFVSIVGPSGCGKTTLLNILSGLEPLQIGAVTVAGAPPAPGRAEVAFMQARDPLLAWLIVEDN